VAGAPRECTFWRVRYGSNAVLKSPRDCTMLGSSMRRVGLIDITVGNATRLGASQRSATRRSASHHIATQRLSRWGSPAARAFSADGLPQAPVAPRRSCEAKYMRADEFAASRRAVLERRYRLTARARSGRPPSSNPDQPICGLSDGHLRLAQFDLSQKSHKVAILLGIILLSALSLPDRREGGSGGSRCRRPLELSSGGSKFP
jgi:hypothetical protein